MNIHDSMLFRWVGYNIEQSELAKLPAPRRRELSLAPSLTEPQIKTYLKYLGDALNPQRGLKVSVYDEVDAVGKHKPVSTPKPCLFFTEQAAGDTEGHWQRYGRMGFGFSKRFIFKCGGRPVIYAGGAHDPVLASVTAIRRTLAKEFKEGHKIRREFETLARFIKGTALPPKLPDETEPKPIEPPAQTKAAKKGKGVTRTDREDEMIHEFPDEKPIRFLREREWRLLQRDNSDQLWRTDADESIWFTPEAGRDLQLIIMPSNQLLQRAYEKDEIRLRLKGKSGVAAQLISAQALRKL